jgi:hypothetical protein
MSDKHQKFAFEVSLKELIDRMDSVQQKGRKFDPSLKGYVKYRKILVDWMCDLGDTMKISQNTIHHSVAMMDSYFSVTKEVS